MDENITELITLSALPEGIETKEQMFSPHDFRIEANTYRTREVLDLEICVTTKDGAQITTRDKWHSLKGGFSASKIIGGNTKSASITYLILFNPINSQWLKVVPPEVLQTDNEGLAAKLKRSFPISKAALEIAGLPDLSSQLTECRVKFPTKDVYGQIAPHTGPSLEYYIKKKANTVRSTSSNQKSFYSEVYRIAFNQAKRLYLEYGYWTEDPNPGNILLHFRGSSIHVVLIDFSNDKQKADNQFLNFPTRERQKSIDRKLQNLTYKFSKTCASFGIPFNILKL